MHALGRAIPLLYLAGRVMGAGVLLSTVQADAVPFWGAKASMPIDTPINRLKKGEFLWMSEAVTKARRSMTPLKELCECP